MGAALDDHGRTKMSYATDGKCHNANTGTFNAECRKPSTWVGIRRDRMFRSGFCDHCKDNGDERNAFDLWIPAVDYVGHPSYRS
jgi:hypothetical protein